MINKTIVLTTEEYNTLKFARMTGKFSYDFSRKMSTNEVTFDFSDNAVKMFCKNLEKHIDFGATSAFEMFAG